MARKCGAQAPHRAQFLSAALAQSCTAHISHVLSYMYTQACRCLHTPICSFWELCRQPQPFSTRVQLTALTYGGWMLAVSGSDWAGVQSDSWLAVGPDAQMKTGGHFERHGAPLGSASAACRAAAWLHALQPAPEPQGSVPGPSE